MKTKHTPGPWVMESGKLGKSEIFGAEERMGRTHVATVNDPIADAPNARLIAAAPELLEALKDAAGLLKMVGDDFEELGEEGKAFSVRRRADRMRAAIAKAEGNDAR